MTASEPQNPAGIKSHHRFALRDVTLGGVPVPGATVDMWLDGDRAARWSARLWVRGAHPLDAGLLEGTGRSGEHVSGTVRIGVVDTALRRGRETLVEYHGIGPLHRGDALPPGSHAILVPDPI